MNNYELWGFLPGPTGPDSQSNLRAALQNHNFRLYNDIGGEVVSTNPWGLKSLAYPIQKKTTAIYWVAEFKGQSDLMRS
jgi:small subunit ribosomal protein S6